MDRYLGEFTFRSNRRHRENAMFDLLVSAARFSRFGVERPQSS
jgi:hypothetical protein